MTVQFVAGTVRAKAMARRRLGMAAVRSLAAQASLGDALAALLDGPYGRELRPGMSLAQAQHAIGSILLWNVRVLAGWLPPAGAEQLRVLTGWFEIANVDEQLQRFGSAPAAPPYRLGRLATAWPRLAGATSPADVRSVLATSPWGDPGGDTPRLITLGMRLAWARRVAALVEPAAGWATAGVALLVAKEVFAAGHRLSEPIVEAATGLLGTGTLTVSSLAEFGASLRRDARWALAGVQAPEDLWRAEAGWWARLHADGLRLLSGSGFGMEPVVGACALLAADAWRTNAALELAAHGGGPLEVVHAVA